MTARVDVMVVGAGLAGLACAQALQSAGREVVVLETGDAVGGRIRTDPIDGFLLDRGFQLLNPSYPALDGLIDLDALSLQTFEPGVVVCAGGRQRVVADPLRAPRTLPASLRGVAPAPIEAIRFAAYAGFVARLSPRRLRQRDDISWGAALDRAGVNGRLRHQLIEPFLAGVLAEDDQSSSRRFVDLLLRSFVRATPGVPAHGMQALPEQLARTLTEGTVRLSTPARAVRPGVVDTADGSWAASEVVIATDPVQAAVFTGLPTPPMRALTTFYFRTDDSPAAHTMLHVDGDRSGPILNAAVMSDAAPSYCTDGALIAATVLGSRDDDATLGLVRAQLAAMFNTNATSWECVACYPLPGALPAMLPPLQLRAQVRLAPGLLVAGDHRDTASIQGALVSGKRAAHQILQPG